MAKLPPVLPGEVLLEEFLLPLKIGQTELARLSGMSPGRVNEIIKGKRPISADAALRLGQLFRTTAEFWLNLQSHYELELAKDKDVAQIHRRVRPLAAIDRAKALA
jgi:antitoxin HigA-1